MTQSSLARGLCTAVLWSGLAYAQVTTATFYGVVQDSSGATVPAAKASLINRDTGALRAQVTDSKGEFGFQFVPVGVYTLRIEASGFKTWESVQVELRAAQQVRQVYVLQVGEITQKLEVGAGAPVVNTVTAEQQESVSTREVEALPVLRRTLSNLMTLASGMTDTGLGRFNLNGLGQSGTSFTMDGIDASGNPQAPQAQFKEGQNYIAVVSMEAVQEVQVSKGVFSAEYGRTLGGNINVITKSGTNTWHGSAFELFNSEELNARLQFLTVKPGATFNQFGGSVGGPIIKDRSFIFAAYEGYQERTAQAVQGNVPTPRLRAAMLAAVPAYKPVLDLFPLPNQPFNPAAATGNYIAAASFSSSDNHVDVRSDTRLSDKAMLTATYVHATPASVTPRLQALDPQNFDGSTNRLNLNFTYIGGPKWSSETRFGYNRDDRNRVDGIWNIIDGNKTEAQFGGRRLPGINALGFSVGGEYNIIGRAPHKSLDQKVSLTTGRHSVKFGGIFIWDEIGSDNIQNPTVTYQTEADLIANIPNAINLTFGRNDADGKAKEWGLFIQDDFRVSSRLTVNLGMRYDYLSRFTVNAPGSASDPPHIYNFAGLTLPTFQFTGFRPVNDAYHSDPFNLGPRFGFAFNPDGRGKTVIRGGFAVMFTQINGEIVKNMIQNSPNEPFRANLSRTNAQQFGLRYPVYNEDVLPLVKGGVVTPNFQYMDPNIKAPYSMNFSMTVERALTDTLGLETAFVGTRGVKFINERDFNLPDRVTGRVPNPAILSDRFYDNSDSTHYYAWQSTLRRRFARGLVANLHYTWSKAIAYSRGDIGFGNTIVQDFFDIRSNKGRAESDVAHNFVADFVYHVPIPAAWSGRAMRTALSGWEVSGILSARTGMPLSITEPNVLNGQRPDLIDPAHAVLNSGLQYLNKAAFAAVPVSSVSGATVRPGTLGNDAISGPGLWNLNAAVGKGFKLAERFNLRLRAELLNAFNHTNFTSVSTNIQSGTFGQLNATGGARQVQLGLRLAF